MSNENDAFDNLMNDFLENEEASSADVDPAASNDEAPEAAEEAEESVSEEEDTSDESEEEDDSGDGEVEASEDGTNGEPQPQRKAKKSAQERINEVVAQRRQAERELAEARAELERVKAEQSAPKPKTEQEIKAPTTPAGDRYGLKEPTPEDIGEDGELKYPLGTFDPNFMRDINRYDRAVERAYEVEVARAQAAEKVQREEEEALFTTWNAKLAAAQKTSPNILDKAQNLVDTFEGGNAEHLQGIARTIMELDNGPQVLEYLADNLDEAEAVVNSTPTKALVLLGRLDAMFIEEETDTPPPLKPTSAPKPPTNLARGKSGKKQTATTMYDKMLREFN